MFTAVLSITGVASIVSVSLRDRHYQGICTKEQTTEAKRSILHRGVEYAAVSSVRRRKRRSRINQVMRRVS
jgi:hypothetical protein